MFRVKESDLPEHRSTAEVFAGVTLTIALLANLVGVILAWRQYRSETTWEENAAARMASLVGSPQWVTAALLLCTSTSVFLILLCIAGYVWLALKYPPHGESLRRVKMLAHNILASMDHGVITTDPEDVITSINTAGIQLLGVKFECVGQALSQIRTPGLPLIELTQLVISGKEPVSDRDFSLQTPKGVQRIRVDSHSLRDTNGEQLGCVVHLRNVTERILLEERMSRMERFISLGSLASGLHHEIKNPLTALGIHVQLLEERLQQPQSTEPIDELLDVLKTEIRRLNGVLERFRSFTNLQRLSIQPTDVLDALEDLIRLVRPQAAQQAVHVTLHHSENELPKVPLDVEKFEQAVLNVMLNALEAMPKGGILSISATQQAQWFQVEVADTGSGIPEEIRPQLFKPYFSTKANGTGMGLALTEKLISQHGGNIDVRSGPAGTTFRIRLPIESEKGEV